MSAARQIVPFEQFEKLREARDILRHEAEAVQEAARRLDERFCTAVTLLAQCRGRVVVTGIGKAGIIGQKVAATLSSTGTRAQFLHSAEAVHGDLGCLSGDDVVLAFSNSGETAEVCRLLPILARLSVRVIAITASDRSTLAREATVIVPYGRVQEAGIGGLAPSTSTSVMLAVGDALALVTARMRGFTPEQFATFHPGGQLGRRLTLVREIMRPLNDIRVAAQTSTVREVLTSVARPGRRTGAVILVDETGRLGGLFTDSDLARLLESRLDRRLDEPVCAVMAADPITIRGSATLEEAVDTLADRKISELPVVDEDRRPIGLIDITDVIGLFPPAPAPAGMTSGVAEE
jgi:arabinose-5-phosphate isomerase